MPNDRAELPEGECYADDRCGDCGRGARESRFEPGRYYLDHDGTCPQNSALQVCERCGHRHVDLDFGEALACIMDVPLEQGREMQRRIVERLQR